MRILITNDDGIHAPGLDVCERIARALSDDVWVVAPETDQSGVSHSLSLNDPLRLREVGDAALRGEGHADRLRHHGRAPHHDGPSAGPRAVRRQSRAERRRGRDSIPAPIAGAMEGTMLGIPSFALSQAYGPATRSTPIGTPRSQLRPEIIRKSAGRRHAARRAGQHQFPGLRAGRGEGHRGDDARQARPGIAADRAAPRRARQSVLLDRLCAQASGRSRRDGTDLVGARRQPHFGDAAAARPDRRAVHDASSRSFK